MPRIALYVCVAALSTAAALRLPAAHGQQQSRRSVLASAAGAAAAMAATAAQAKVSEIGSSGLSKEEFYAALAARKETDRIAALPINQIKRARDRFAAAPSLIESDNWDGLRDLIQQTTGSSLTQLEKAGNYQTKEVRALTNKMRKLLFDVDTFAYSQQSVPGADVFAGYCAAGVTPRETGGCKVKPSADKAPQMAKVKDAVAVFDQIVATCGA